MIRKFDGFIAIGCIIKGETANFDLISNAITNGIMKISINQKTNRQCNINSIRQTTSKKRL